MSFNEEKGQADYYLVTSLAFFMKNLDYYRAYVIAVQTTRRQIEEILLSRKIRGCVDDEGFLCTEI